MAALMFAPVRLAFGLMAGFLGKKAFDLIWSQIDDEEAPEPEHREIALQKLAIALALQGAIFRLVRGLFDHASRSGFARITGRWPGEPRPEPT